MKQIVFLRHAQSLSNIGYNILNPTLSKKGVEQASLLTGHYNVVVVSELRRSKDTLDHSKITYDNLIVTSLTNEVKMGHISECTSLLKCGVETKEEVQKRIDLFKNLLNELWDKYDSILVISHAEFIKRFVQSNEYLDNAESLMFEVVE